MLSLTPPACVVFQFTSVFCAMLFPVIASLATGAAGDVKKKPCPPRKESLFRHREAQQRRGDLTFISPKDKIASLHSQ
jgi:hypothetical protein